MDDCATVLRCLYEALPLERISSDSRDNKAENMDVFAQKYAHKLGDVVKQEQPDFTASSMKYALYNWLGRIATSGGDGKRIKLGIGKNRCRFEWSGFYLQDEKELWGLVQLAISKWQNNVAQ